MKKALLILSGIMLFCLASYGQTTTYYHYDYRTGVKTKVGESQYSDNATNTGFAPYYPSYDVNAYARVGQQLQQRYDANLNSIKESVQQTQDLIDRLPIPPDKRPNTQRSFNDILEMLSGKHDYSQQNIYDWAMMHLSAFRRALHESYD